MYKIGPHYGQSIHYAHRALTAWADQSLSGCKDSVLVTSTMESQSGRRTQSLLVRRESEPGCRDLSCSLE